MCVCLVREFGDLTCGNCPQQMSGTSEEDGVSDKLRHLNTEINSHVTKLEELGQRGEVEEAQVLLKELEGLERERETERAIQAREMSKVSCRPSSVYTGIIVRI